jgi:hypothetical protein
MRKHRCLSRRRAREVEGGVGGAAGDSPVDKERGRYGSGRQTGMMGTVWRGRVHPGGCSYGCEGARAAA